MIGNDVVDLAHASVQAGAQHPRFHARVFAECERAELARHPEEGAMRWHFWAAKEAAYKAAKKSAPETIWSPAKFVVELRDAGDGGDGDARVRHDARVFVVRFLQTQPRLECVHALARAQGERNENGSTMYGVARVRGGDPSAAVREHARQALARRLKLARARLRIETRARIPFLTVDGARAAFDISLSHHGRFVAWAARTT